MEPIRNSIPIKTNRPLRCTLIKAPRNFFPLYFSAKIELYGYFFFFFSFPAVPSLFIYKNFRIQSNANWVKKCYKGLVCDDSHSITPSTPFSFKVTSRPYKFLPIMMNLLKIYRQSAKLYGQKCPQYTNNFFLSSSLSDKGAITKKNC